MKSVLTSICFQIWKVRSKKLDFLGCMVKCSLKAFTDRRKCNNKDDFGNKRLDLVGELLEGELRAHILYSRKR